MVVNHPDKLIFTTKKIATQALKRLYNDNFIQTEHYLHDKSIPEYVSQIEKSNREIYILMRDPVERCWSGFKESLLNERDPVMNDLFYSLNPTYARDRDYCGSVLEKLKDNTLTPDEVLRGITKVMYKYSLHVLQDSHIYTGYYTFIDRLLSVLPVDQLEKINLVDINKKKNKELLVDKRILTPEIFHTKGESLSVKFVKERVIWWYLIDNITIESRQAYNNLQSHYENLWFHNKNFNFL